MGWNWFFLQCLKLIFYNVEIQLFVDCVKLLQPGNSKKKTYTKEQLKLLECTYIFLSSSLHTSHTLNKNIHFTIVKIYVKCFRTLWCPYLCISYTYTILWLLNNYFTQLSVCGSVLSLVTVLICSLSLSVSHWHTLVYTYTLLIAHSFFVSFTCFTCLIFVLSRAQWIWLLSLSE